MNQSAKPLHILLVEDDAAHAKLVRRACRMAESPLGLSVVGTLADARQWMASNHCDLIVVDLVLPDGQGITLIPEDPASAPYPLIVLTAQGSEQAAVAALKAGAYDYVVKTDVTLADTARIARRAVREWGARAELKAAQDEAAAAERLARDILNSLPSPVALVHRSGVLVRTNVAWNDPQLPTGLYGPDCPIGTNYPEYCRVRGQSDIAVLVEDALSQPSSAIWMEYGCQRDSEARWMEMCIKPFVGDGQGRAIVMHFDVTAQRRDEKQAKQQAEALKRLRVLSEREMQVLNRIVQGLANKDIGAQLRIAVKTVEMHRTKLVKKLGASGTTEVIRIALSAFPEWRGT